MPAPSLPDDGIVTINDSGHYYDRGDESCHLTVSPQMAIYGSLLTAASTERGDDPILSWSLKRVQGESIALNTYQVQEHIDANTPPTNPSRYGAFLQYLTCSRSTSGHTRCSEKKKVEKLGQWPATAICGNDITASCLYVIGVCTLYAGFWAPVCLLIVAGLLYLFKSIYSEVGSALALNGASYTLLLNTTSKKTASLAACLTIISYMATAVVSSTTAIQYLSLVPGCSKVSLFWGTVGLLAFFAFLSLIGITESATTALVIFFIHICSLSLLVFYCALYAVVQDRFHTLKRNWYFSSPTIDNNSILSSVFYGFGAAMLGVTGFESSANFIEQQKRGVFPKTLRNMWILTFIFNPTISFLSLCTMPLEEIVDPTKNANLLSQMGMKAGGTWLRIVLSVDAFLVLSGSVLTGYVGIVGLLRQMAMDRCFPTFFLKTNRIRGTNHWIIISFFLVCVSMILLLGQEQIANLAGVYTISFLSVMFLFALGDMLLKYKRGKIHRGPHASRTVVVVAMIGVIVALAANIFANPEHFAYFAAYYGVCACIVLAMLWRVRILKFLIFMMYTRFKSFRPCLWFVKKMISHAQQINSQSVIYFSKDDSLAQLNKAVLYVRTNEPSAWVRIVHVYHQTDTVSQDVIQKMEQNVKILDELYPKLRVDFVAFCTQGLKAKESAFGPEVIDMLEQYFGVRKNLMFISCPSDNFRYKVADLGLRIITTD